MNRRGPVLDEFTEEVRVYLESHGGDFPIYLSYVTGEQREGQAFFNALSIADQRTLWHTGLDTFHATGERGRQKVRYAIAHLMKERQE